MKTKKREQSKPIVKANGIGTAPAAAESTHKLSKDQVDLIRKMFAKGLNDDEFKLFVMQAEAFGLNPIRREIFCYKFGDTPQFIVGRDGFLSIAHRNSNFAGIQSGAIRNDSGVLLGAWCEVRRKDWQVPFRAEVDLKEYNTGKSLWATKPQTMIIKVAESQALRKTFNINGLYDESEWDSMKYSTVAVDTKSNGNSNGVAKSVQALPPSQAIEADAPVKAPVYFISAEQRQKIIERVADIAIKLKVAQPIIASQLRGKLKFMGLPSLASLPIENYDGIMTYLDGVIAENTKEAVK